MKALLGELLVRAKACSAADVEEAKGWQVLYGGRMGTNLLELGFVDEAALAQQLGVQQSCEWTSGELALSEAMIQAVPGVIARRAEIVPWKVEDKRLKVLCISPAQHLPLFDEIGFRLGRVVKPVVAPEFRVHQALRRYFQSVKQMRALDFGVKPKGKKKVAGEKKAEAAQPDLMDEASFAAVYAQVLTGQSNGAVPEPDLIDLPSEDPTPQAGSAQVFASSSEAPTPLRITSWPKPPGVRFPTPAAPPQRPHSAGYGRLPTPSEGALAPTGIPPGWTGAPPPPVPRAVTPEPDLPLLTAVPYAIPAKLPAAAGSPQVLDPERPTLRRGVPSGLRLPTPVPPPVLPEAPTPIATPDFHRAQTIIEPTPLGLFVSKAPTPESGAISPQQLSAAFDDLEKHLAATQPDIKIWNPSPLTFKEATDEIHRASDRESVAQTLLRYARSRASRAVVLHVQGDLALGWDALGEGLSTSAARKIAVSLSVPSAFQIVRDTRTHYFGPMPLDRGNVRFLKAAGNKWPESAALLPIQYAGRVVYIVYADNGHKEHVGADVREWTLLLQSVTRRFEQLMTKTATRTR